MPEIRLPGGCACPFTRKVRIVFDEKSLPFYMMPCASG